MAFQAAFGLLGGEAEVELHGDVGGDNVGCACAAVDVGDLEAGGGEVGVAVVPLGVDEFGERGGGAVDGVFGEMGIGDVSLLAVDFQAA